MFEQDSLFDFDEMNKDQQSEIKDEIKYYIEKDEMGDMFINEFVFCYQYSDIYFSNGYIATECIGLLKDNQVYKNEFVYQFKNEKEAKSYFSEEYKAIKERYERKRTNSERYPIVKRIDHPIVEQHLYLIEEPTNDISGNKAVYAPSWYSGLNGFSSPLTLPYEDKMDIKGRILYQKDKISRLGEFIQRDIDNGFTDYPVFFDSVDEFLVRVDYLKSDLQYQNEEFYQLMPDMDMLNVLLKEHENKQEIELEM